MSRATLKNVASVGVGDKEIKFDPPVSVWQAIAQAAKARRETKDP